MAVETLPQSTTNQSYSHMGTNFGHPALNLMMAVAFGKNLMPSVDEGQDMYDAFLQRQRSQHFLQLQQSGAANNMLFKSLGMDTQNPILKTLSSMAMHSPDSMFGKMLSPLMGGNPMAASMQLYGGLTGAGVMGNFGRASSITVGETESTMASLLDKMYTSHGYDEPGGVRENINKKTQNRLLELTKDNKNDNYLRGLGIEVERTATGELTEQTKQRIGSFEVAERSDQEGPSINKTLRENARVREMVSSELEESLGKILKTDKADTNRPKEIEALKTRLQKELNIPQAQLDPLFGEDFEKTKGKDVSKIIRDFKTLTPEEKEARKAATAKEAGKQYGAMNFENTLGSKVEDFTSGFVKASQLRGLGETKGVNIAAKMQDFSENAGGALNAARSVFGNKSGGELVQKISDMMGDSMNLATREGGGEAEKLLRNVKATADVAGISIKAMLSVIDSTKELAANNPRLASISAEATTKMAVRAVTRATEMGASMSAKEYRQEGGERGILAGETARNDAFLGSGLTQQMAAISAVVKGLGTTKDEKGNVYDPSKELNKMMAAGEFTPESFDSGEAARKIEKLTNGRITAADLPRYYQSKELIAEGMKDTQFVNAALEGSNKIVHKSLWQEISNYTGGKFSEDVYKQRMAEERKKGSEGRTGREVFMSLAGSLAGNRTLMAKAMTFGGELRQSEREASRPPQEKARIQNMINERAEQAARLERSFAANRSPIPQQLLSAILEGKDFAGTAESIAGIFATKDTARGEQKEAITKASEAAVGITEISQKAQGSQTEFERLGITEKLNTFIGGRKADIEARGEDSGRLDTNISTEDYKQEMATLKNTGLKSTKEAKAKLIDLKADKAAGRITEGSAQDRTLKALETASKAGHLDSDAAFSEAKKGTWEGLSAATIQAQRDTELERVGKEEKGKVFESLGKNLESISKEGKGDEINKAVAHYRKTMGDSASRQDILQQMLKDWQNPSDERGGQNYFVDSKTHKRKENIEQSSFGEVMEQAQKNIAQTEEYLQVTKDKAGDKSTETNQQLITAINNLVDSITSGGAIGKALSEFSTALNAVR